MKVAVLCESPADEAALRILISAMLGEPAEPVEVNLRANNRQTVISLSPVAIRALHFGAEAEGFVAVVDSDKSPPHSPTHEVPGKQDPACRLCKLKNAAKAALERAGRRPAGLTLKTAFGLAVPSIEAWFQVGRDGSVTEAVWEAALKQKQFSYDVRKLKIAVYGHERVGLEEETRRMTEEATRISTKIEDVATWFPSGFGSFLADVRSWKRS